MDKEQLADLSSAQKIQELCNSIVFMAYQLETIQKTKGTSYATSALASSTALGGIHELCKIAEEFGNALNGVDFFAPIDEIITQVAFEIVNEELT